MTSLSYFKEWHHNDKVQQYESTWKVLLQFTDKKSTFIMKSQFAKDYDRYMHSLYIEVSLDLWF